MGKLIFPEIGHLLQFSFIVFNSMFASVRECVHFITVVFYHDTTGIDTNSVFFL